MFIPKKTQNLLRTCRMIFIFNSYGIKVYVKSILVCTTVPVTSVTLYISENVNAVKSSLNSKLVVCMVHEVRSAILGRICYFTRFSFEAGPHNFTVFPILRRIFELKVARTAPRRMTAFEIIWIYGAPELII